LIIASSKVRLPRPTARFSVDAEHLQPDADGAVLERCGPRRAGPAFVVRLREKPAMKLQTGYQKIESIKRFAADPVSQPARADRSNEAGLAATNV